MNKHYLPNDFEQNMTMSREPPGARWWKCRLTTIFFAVIGAFLLVYKPADVPPLFHDEGWNLTVARNWVESGRYVALLNGHPVAPSMLSVGFPGILPLALSFRIFGIGPLQARLPGIFFTAAAIALICYIAHRLFGRQVAAGTLMVLLLMPMRPDLHPVIVGRQAMGEMPALFYLLAGYACLLVDRPGWSWVKPLTLGWWGLAMLTKAQAIPFLLLALLVPLAVMLFKRQWKAAALISAGLFGSLIIFAALIWSQKYLLNDPMPTPTHIGSWSTTTAVVPVVFIRFWVLRTTLLLGLPLLLGLVWATLGLVRSHKNGTIVTKTGMVRLSLFVLCSSWFAWYVFLSIGWVRYLFPAMFLGSIFISELLHNFIDGFNVLQTLKNASSVLLSLCFDRKSLTALLTVAVMAWVVLIAAYGLFQSYISPAGQSPSQVAAFLNAHTPPDALIECSEAELFFLLNRPYHYPSGDIGMQLIRRSFWGERVVAHYDPLGENPSYLVIGPAARLLHVYETALKSGQFTLVAAFESYDIYRRIR